MFSLCLCGSSLDLVSLIWFPSKNMHISLIGDAKLLLSVSVSVSGLTTTMHSAKTSSDLDKVMDVF